jgi:hypothetical protein
MSVPQMRFELTPWNLAGSYSSLELLRHTYILSFAKAEKEWQKIRKSRQRNAVTNIRRKYLFMGQMKRRL